MKNIAIFASGSGTNAENLVRHFTAHPNARVVMMVSDRRNALVFERMKRLEIPSYYMSRDDFENGNVLQLLLDNNIDLIVLAGFLKLMPAAIISAFPKKIINIHPALLPKYGGKGMYGKYVHEAVVRAGESKTGITIHYVNEYFDEGEMIAQFETGLTKEDTPDNIASKIHELEMKWYPLVIEEWIKKN
jgi:phosphoribosylglycinamide formyltransferase-1